MNEYDSNFEFPVIDDGEEFDFEAIFGKQETPAPVPVLEPAAEEPIAVPVEVTAPPVDEQPKPPAENTESAEPLLSLFPTDTAAEEPKPQAAPAEPLKKEPENTDSASLFDKPPVFSYGGAKENIADASITFEELRIQKADDFPELEEAKSVTWRVRYGTTTKAITDPKGTTVIQIKEEIERSKAFLDSLKKGKDKNPSCLVTPSVTAKSKGIAAYKGVFTSLETARTSDKVICLIPSQDGQVYELRKNELGEFIAPKHNIKEFPKIRAGFRPALPQIPRQLIGQLIAFFRGFMGSDHEYEALAQIYWDRETEEFAVHIPKQTASKASIHADMRNNTLPDDRYLHYADVHSHNSMAAKFSCTDDHDERPTGLYIVIGRLDRFYPDISARISCGGTFHDIDPSLVLENLEEEFPLEWIDQVETVNRQEQPRVSFPKRWKGEDLE